MIHTFNVILQSTFELNGGRVHIWSLSFLQLLSIAFHQDLKIDVNLTDRKEERLQMDLYYPKTKTNEIKVELEVISLVQTAKTDNLQRLPCVPQSL